VVRPQSRGALLPCRPPPPDGLRRRTILSLRWRGVDLEQGHWRIPGEFVKTRQDYQQPMAASVVEALKSLRSQQLEKKGSDCVSGESPIFGLTPESSFKHGFQSVAPRAGIEGLTFHDLRRVFLTRLRERGVNIETAMQFYRQVPESDVKSAVEEIDRDCSSQGGTSEGAL